MDLGSLHAVASGLLHIKPARPRIYSCPLDDALSQFGLLIYIPLKKVVECRPKSRNCCQFSNFIPRRRNSSVEDIGREFELERHP